MTFSPKHSKITSEAIRAELRLLKEDESRIEALRSAIDEGVQSGIAAGFNPESHLAEIKHIGKLQNCIAANSAEYCDACVRLLRICMKTRMIRRLISIAIWDFSTLLNMATPNSVKANRRYFTFSPLPYSRCQFGILKVSSMSIQSFLFILFHWF